MTARFLLYSHDALGLGHVRRNLAIARALTDLAPEVAVLVVSGSDEIDRLGGGHHIDVLKLPGMRKLDNGGYAARRLPLDAREIRALRSALLAAAVGAFRPAVVLADKHPLGVRGELKAALDIARAAGAKTVLGLRDILDDPESVQKEWAAYDLLRVVEERYDAILVYGHPAVFDLVAAYEWPAALADRTRHCGYVATPGGSLPQPDDPQPPPVGRRRGPLVVATAGGGEDGRNLLDTFTSAVAGTDWEGVVIAGPHCEPDVREHLRRRSGEAGMAFHAFVANLDQWFDAADVVVCMAGYNTVVETVSRGLPVVCVPRPGPRAEQRLRAQAFADLGLLHVVDPERLDPATLRTEVTAAIADGRRDSPASTRGIVDFDGARRAAAHLLELAGSGETPR
jgi:predicted glycosyltransferase